MPNIIYTDTKTGVIWTMRKYFRSRDIYGNKIKTQPEVAITQNGQSVYLSRFQVQTILKYLMEK